MVISSFSQMLLKKGAQRKHGSIIREYLNPWVIIGYVMMVAATVTTILAYRGLEYKNGPVIESLGYILVMLLSWLFFREKLTWRKLIGNAMILAGVVIFYMG